MSEERKAGQLILSQLGMFNEAVVLLENVIEPAVIKGIFACAESFAEDNDWDEEHELESDYDCWLAPKSWITNPGEEGPNFMAKFEFDCIEGDSDYLIALFCGFGTQGGQAGFSFLINASAFGGKNAWNACAKKIPQELISRLTALGFRNQGKGNFFLPITLDNQQLVNSWSEYGEFTKDDDSFNPLRAALENLKQAVPIFDQIMQGCSGASRVK